MNTEKFINVVSNSPILTVAGGCFWGMEELLKSHPGVVDTTVGYTGGTLSDPTYEMICTGKTGHAEAVQVMFDPTLVSYEDLLRFFFKIHDPTTLNKQGHDMGSQYRSAIFYNNESQKTSAIKIKEEINASKAWPAPIVTEIVQLGTFHAAEEYHQDYLQKNPGGYSCHYIRN